MEWINSFATMLAQATQPNPKAQMIQLVGMGVVMMVFFYLVVIRPQSKKAKEHAELLKGIKPGDKVVTSGGLLGVVITVKEKTVSLRSADTKLEVLKSAVIEVTERGNEPAQA